MYKAKRQKKNVGSPSAATSAADSPAPHAVSWPRSDPRAQDPTKISSYRRFGQQIFLYLIHRDFAKIYGPSKILQKYTYGDVGHGARV
jgi:hypothetical protein